MKLTIVGAGSTYTPGLVLRWIETKRDRIPLTEICLYDVDAERLDVVGRFIEEMIRHEAPALSVTRTTDRRVAIEGSSFVVLQLRVGLNRQRQIDEHLCVKHGFIGQETTGPGGFILALRQIPASLEIARDVRRYAPQAWLISVANPAGILAEALIKYGHERTIGMCHGGFFPRATFARLLGVEEDRIDFDYYGLNHLGWISKIYLDGKLLGTEEAARLGAAMYSEWSRFEPNLPPEFASEMAPHLTCHHYMASFYLHDELLAEQEGKTRADAVLGIENECLNYYRNEVGRQFTPPEVLSKRGGVIEEKGRRNYGAIGYSDGCLAIIEALLYPEPQQIVVNVLNEGAIDGLPADAAVEVNAMVNSTGVRRLAIGEMPIEVRGQIQAVKAYETMTVRAALSGNRNHALQALLSHPICHCRYFATKTLLNELLEANREFLPTFFGPGSMS